MGHRMPWWKRMKVVETTRGQRKWGGVGVGESSVFQAALGLWAKAGDLRRSGMQ